ncbi:Os02g0195533, partial [Oryza sativa Japonica Group]
RWRTDEVSPELDAGALPPAVGRPGRRKAGLRAEAPHEAVDVEEEQVLQVGLLGLPVHGARLQPHVVQRRLRQERAAARGDGAGAGAGAPEVAVEHEPVERVAPRGRDGAREEPPRHERHPGGLVGGGEVAVAVVVVAVAVAVGEEEIEHPRRLDLAVRPLLRRRGRALRVRRRQPREPVRAVLPRDAIDGGGQEHHHHHHDPNRRRRHSRQEPLPPH